MIGLLVGGVVAMTVLIVMGVLGAVISLVFGLVLLPFKLLSLTFRGLGVLLALPFLLLFAIGGMLVFGMGALMFLVPFFPLVLLALGIGWLVKRKARPLGA